MKLKLKLKPIHVMTASKKSSQQGEPCWKTHRNLILVLQISLIIGILWSNILEAWERVLSRQVIYISPASKDDSYKPGIHKVNFGEKNDSSVLVENSDRNTVNGFGHIFTNYSLYSKKWKNTLMFQIKYIPNHGKI